MQFSPSVTLALVALTSVGFLAVDHQSAPLKPKRTALVGNPRLLEVRYANWKETHASRDVRMPLAFSRALSTERSSATGRFVFDADAGVITVDLESIPADAHYDAWLVDDAAGTSAAPDARDRLARLGELVPAAGRAHLAVQLAESELVGFDLDLVVITRAGASPIESIVLSGMPGLFQRLYSRELEAGVSTPSGVVLRTGSAIGNGVLGGGGSGGATYGPSADLVAEGEHLFFFGTFAGNGRTCGTCHPAENNFTIEPAFIATLPDSDPLFVAEFNPDLNFDLNGGLRFENPHLMRDFGLIVENLDGFDDLRYRFTMRSVPHTLGMTQSMTSPDGPGVVPEQRTGWSGDGAPGQGTLREFALGAVRQHFTRTMGRVPNVDFVFPTSAELDAFEAFQLSLGRQQELDIANMTLLDAGADEGRVRFDEVGCTRCHENAGANRVAVNNNFNTGVEAFGRHNPDGTGELRPPDGGLGTNAAGGSGTVVASPEFEDPDVFSFGNKTFNTASLVEFADTVPGFHNNITNMGALADTVEGAVSFYRSSEFENSVDGFPIPFQGNDIDNIGRFLRVINALENRRSADVYADRAAQLIQGGGYDPADVERLLVLAQAECTDAIDELSQVGLHLNDAVPRFQKAWGQFEAAKTGSDASRLSRIAAGRHLLDNAKSSMEL